MNINGIGVVSLILSLRKLRHKEGGDAMGPTAQNVLFFPRREIVAPLKTMGVLQWISMGPGFLPSPSSVL